MIDAAADPARLALLPCPHCPHTSGLYLLESAGPLVFTQCLRCHTRGWMDTGCGQGRPDHIGTELPWPT